jgi:hypothetical protein
MKIYAAGGKMNWAKRTIQFLSVCFAVLAFGGTAQAQTGYLRSGASCAGPTSASYTPGNPFQVSLCADIAASSRGLCGTTAQLVAANAGESDLFRVTAVSATPTGYDASQAPGFPVSINSPTEGTDFGFTKSSGSPNAPAPADGILLITFTITPNGASANSYTLGLGGISDLITKTQGSSCLTAGLVSTPISPTIVVTKASAPTTITGNAPTPLLSGTTSANHVTYTNDGSPVGNFSVTAGALPAGLSLSVGGVLSGQATTPGTYNFTVTATNATGSTSKAQTVMINAATQTITFNNPGTQPFSASPFVSGATSNSGLAVVLSSGTPTVCTVAGLNIVFVTAGSCTINADAAAGTNAGTTYLVATQVSRAFTITAGVPQPPTGAMGSAGFQTATISFTAPTNTGGSPITGYTATCVDAMMTSFTNSGAGSPRTVTGLTNGTSYNCSVVATNAQGNSGPSNVVAVTPVNIAPPAFTNPATTPTAVAMTVATVFGPLNITASGGPSPTITQTGGLPMGITFTGGTPTGTASLQGTPTQAGSFTATLTAMNASGTATSVLNITVAKANQTITFPAQTTATRTFSATPFAISPVATTTSPLAITYSSGSPGVCSVTGTNVTAITVGNCVINADQAGDTNYNAAMRQTSSVMITQASQTITFGAQTSPRGFSATPIPLNPVASASSGLAVTYSTNTGGVCSVSGATFTPITLGTCTILVNQAGNTNFAAAMQVQQSVLITQGSQTITFGGPGQIQLTTTTALSASATSNLPITFASTTPTTCTTTGTNGATLTAVALGTCSVTATQVGNALFAAATPVTAAIQVIPLGGIVVTPSSNPSAYAQPVTLTIRITGTNPTGTVSVLAGSPSGIQTPVCTNVPLVNAAAICVTPASLMTTNPVVLSITYSGDAANAAGSLAYQQLVDLGAITLTAVSSPLQVLAGRNVNLKAMVVGKTITNGVTFFENGVALAGCNNVPVRLLPGSTEIGVADCNIAGIAAGSHSYAVNYPLTGSFRQVELVVNAAASGPEDYTDMWWAGKSEDGWGVSITQHRTQQFAVLYVYDDFGKPTFYVMSGGIWNATNTAITGSLYLPTSSPFSSYDPAQFRPGGAANGPVGMVTITYTSASAATLTYTINGVSGTKQIVRQPFGGDDGQPKLQVGDMWWGGASQDGWGINIAQQGRVIFPVWYTYNATGNPVFFTVPGGSWSGNTFSGDVYSTTSSKWLGVGYVVGSFTAAKVGTMSITFADQNNGLMTYSVNGVTQSKLIVRQPF